MNVNSFMNVAPKLPAQISVLMRGPTGIGKSQLAKQVADELGLPFIDIRGSTMQEGDVIGYPDLEGMKESGVSSFCLPAWYIRGCKEPVVIMLDELNRSLHGVMQSFFQIVLDRHLAWDVDGEPIKLHPQTRIIAAVNAGAEYDVNEMDPALLRRFWVADIEPDVESWSNWAKKENIDSILIEFVAQHPQHFVVDTGKVEPGKVIPTPASWHRLDTCLKHMEMQPSDTVGQPTPAGMYALCMGMIGTEASINFCDFVSKYERVISAEDVMRDNFNTSLMENLPASEIVNLIQKVANHCEENDWAAEQVENLYNNFVKSLTGEMLVHLWNKVAEKAPRLENIKLLHSYIGMDVVEAVKASRS